MSLPDGLTTLDGIQLQLTPTNLVCPNVQISGIDPSNINNITLQVTWLCSWSRASSGREERRRFHENYAAFTKQGRQEMGHFILFGLKGEKNGPLIPGRTLCFI